MTLSIESSLVEKVQYIPYFVRDTTSDIVSAVTQCNTTMIVKGSTIREAFVVADDNDNDNSTVPHRTP